MRASVDQLKVDESNLHPICKIVSMLIHLRDSAPMTHVKLVFILRVHLILCCYCVSNTAVDHFIKDLTLVLINFLNLIVDSCVKIHSIQIYLRSSAYKSFRSQPLFELEMRVCFESNCLYRAGILLCFFLKCFERSAGCWKV